MLSYAISLIITLSIIVGFGARCVIFQQRDVAWWKGIIPIYNKYIFGKLCNKGNIGIAVGLLELVWYIACYLLMYFEMWVQQTYNASTADGFIYANVSEEVVTIYTWLKIGFLVYMIFYLVVWCYLMNKFSMMHGKSKNWIALWALWPAAAYCYFALTPKIAMYGKQYELKRVEVATPEKVVKKNERRRK